MSALWESKAEGLLEPIYIHIWSKLRTEERGQKLFEEIVAKTFPHLMKTRNVQIQEVLRTPSKINIKKTMPRYVIIILLKTNDKKKILKAFRGQAW